MSKAYVLGYTFGLLLVFVAAVVVGLFLGKKDKVDKYDEMQKLWQLKSYRAAFWTLAAYITAYSVFDTATGIKWADSMTTAMIGICISITVHAIICIAKNAYFPYNRGRKRTFIMMAVAIALNLLVVASQFIEGIEFVTDGMLNLHSVNMIVLVPFVFIIITLGIKIIACRGKDGE